MDDLISRQRRTYEDFQKHISDGIKPLFSELRDYCFSLGKNVIEDVRMHRIVFCKSMAFRYFADVEPQGDSIIIKIRRDRKESIKQIEIKLNENLEEVKKLILDAYINIH